jgi:hypothetical protein
MKEANKQRLHADFDRLVEQIGILPEEKPRLVLDRKEFHTLLEAIGQRKSAAAYGQCSHQMGVIFCDAGKRSHQVLRFRRLRRRPDGTSYWETPNDGKSGYSYKLRSNGSVEYRTVKATYKTHLHILVHELAHYRFGYMHHNKDFEKRIKEILQGRTFPKKHIDLDGKLSDV